MYNTKMNDLAYDTELESSITQFRVSAFHFSELDPASIHDAVIGLQSETLPVENPKSHWWPLPRSELPDHSWGRLV